MVTCLDGYQMARSGRAGPALGIAAMGSFIAATISIVLLSLVAPVLAKGASERKLYLPRGVWFDWWTSERREGGRETTRPVDLATMPLFVRAGSIIPLDPVRQLYDQEGSSQVHI